MEGSTPLQSAGISDDNLESLSRLWVTSLEEAVALWDAVSTAEGLPAWGQALSCELEPASEVLRTKRPGWKSTQSGGSLGCLLEETTSLPTWTGESTHSPASGLPGRDEELPESVRLMDQLPGVRDQGRRGTCVAFGTVALREFLQPHAERLSEQFLYWACKEVDGIEGPGTQIHTAMSVLSDFGVCPARVWPYVPYPLGTEGQGPPPGGAMESAKEFRLANCLPLGAGLIAQCKRVLAGMDGGRPRPITFGCLVFSSWYFSSETHRTGKITMPLPGESHRGAHAWCLVGYVDAAEVPGGGYFIVRNSWGSSWAKDSPERPGHALIPYAYIEHFAFQAFTGTISGTVSGDPANGLEACTLVLEGSARETTDGRRSSGRRLPAGTVVLVDRYDSSLIRERQGNESAFLARDCTWSDTSWARVWYPAFGSFPGSLRVSIEEQIRAKDEFFATIEENLTELRGLLKRGRRARPTSLLGRLLSCRSGLQFVRSVPVVDVRLLLHESILESTAVGASIAIPRDWRDTLAELSDLRVYEVKLAGRTSFAIVAFLSAFQFQRLSPPHFLSVGREHLGLFAQASERIRLSIPVPEESVFSVIGCSGVSPELADGSPLSGRPTIWTFQREREWTPVPDGQPRHGSNPDVLVDAFRPLPFRTIVQEIGRWLASSIGVGNMTISRIRRDWPYSDALLAAAVLDLAQNLTASYRCYYHQKELAIRRVSGSSGSDLPPETVSE